MSWHAKVRFVSNLQTLHNLVKFNHSRYLFFSFVYFYHFSFSGEIWEPWSEWSAECKPKCLKGDGKGDKIPKKTRFRFGSNEGKQIDTKECDELELCSPGKIKTFCMKVFR